MIIYYPLSYSEPKSKLFMFGMDGGLVLQAFWFGSELSVLILTLKAFGL